MDISKFAKKPELLEITLDNQDIVEEFGDVVVFYMQDYVDIDTYFNFYRTQSTNSEGLNAILAKMVLNKDGQPAIKAGEMLPVNLAVAVLAKVNENLGKLKTRPSPKVTGNPSN